MNQLPGKQSPRWLRLIATGVVTAVSTIWLLSLLPFLLLFALVLALLLIPVMQRLRREMEVTGMTQEARRPTVDVTPWHRQVMLALTQLRNRSSAMRR